jgi:hypothetical protein
MKEDPKKDYLKQYWEKYMPSASEINFTKYTEELL